MLSSRETSEKSGVLHPISTGAKMAFVYAMLFVALMLFTGGTITVDGLGLPAFVLFLIISLVEYIVTRNGKPLPQWLIIGAVLLSMATAVIMTIIFN
ncbi:hypothetical protein ACE1TI_00115 [Alteribacillus sp. JSM 102045]|uniref:hypothetical protein n=1 Tax=Alteribacillus sp. JSM 102045 TaxID=1562101 RepID=UPI0035BF562E